MLTNILQSIGRTPLLRLNALGADLPGTVWLKLENRNPGGSIKDRVAFHVIDKTMEWGDIEAGGTIVEATSGNLGIGIALVAAVGRKMTFRPGISGKIFKALGEEGINIRTIAQGADELSIIVGVDNKNYEAAVQVLYDSFAG